MAFTPDTISVIAQPIGGTGLRLVSYRTDDTPAVVTADGYFVNAKASGLRNHDLVFVTPITGSEETYIVIMEVDASGNGTGSLSSNDITVNPALPFGGTYQRFLSTKLGDVLSAEDFGVQKGVSVDQSAALNDMIDAVSQSATSYLSDMKQVKHEIDLGPGTIYLTNPLTPLPFGMRVRGRGAAATKFLAYGDFAVWSSQEFESNGVTPRYHNSMRFEDFAVISSDPSNPSKVIRARGMIRNSALERVGHQACNNAFDVDRCWTLRFSNCFGNGVSNQTEHHFYLGTECGGILIDAGRFDVADEEILYAVGSDTLELMIRNDAAFQFSKSSGVRVNSARTVDIDGMFLEGNCIDSTTAYHLDVRGSGLSLTSAVISNVAINNLSLSARDGLGIAYIDGFETVEYRERWTRNGVSIVPKFGNSVTRAILDLQSSTTVTSSDLPFLASNASASAEIRQPARPTKYYGKQISSSIGDTGATSHGRLGEDCVMLGTRGGVATIQGHVGNTAKRLDLNPLGGAISSSMLTIRGTVTGSNFTPSEVTPNASIDTSGGNRSVDLSSIGTDLVVGSRIDVMKIVATNNLNILVPSGHSVNGVLGTKTVTSAGRYVIEKRTSTDWYVSFAALA